MTLDELRQLDFKDIGNWPLPSKIGGLLILLILLIAATYWFDWRPLLDQLEAGRQVETSLKETFMQKKRIAVNLESYEKQLAEIKQAFGTLLKQLPKKSEMDALVTDINQAGLSRGLQFELFKPATQETMTEFYAELPVTIKVTGEYHNLGAFASDVAQLPRIVLLNDISITTNKDTGLVMDAVAKTYRYLDDEEMAAREQIKREKDKKGAKK